MLSMGKAIKSRLVHSYIKYVMRDACQKIERGRGGRETQSERDIM